MKRIRMTKTMAGPGGVRSAGQQYTVDDEMAVALVAAGAAEIIAPISDADISAALTPDRENASAVPSMEKAVQPRSAKKRAK